MNIMVDRTLREVEYEIENLGRFMAKLLIHQDDLDHQLAISDRRMAALHKEKEALNVPQL
jgi:hypothetical protein